MGATFNLILDTTEPSNPVIQVNSNSTYATEQLVTLTIGCSDPDVAGYQMVIWGDVDTTYDVAVQDNEVGSSWVTYQTSKQVKLSAGDGEKTIYLRIRDEVHNVSAQVSDSIILDMTLPTVTLSGVDVPKISKQNGKNVASFSFQTDCIFDEYLVKVVSSTGASYDTGTLIGIGNGSTNMSGNAGGYPANTPINCKIYGTDLENASAGDGTKIIKVFVKDEAGQWSA